MTTKHLPTWTARTVQRRESHTQAPLSPERLARLAKIRAEAAEPRTLFVVVRDSTKSIAIAPEDIVMRSDEELAAFISTRLGEPRI